MPDPMDITGRRFGHLTALKFVSRNRHGQARWRCRCDCGHQAVVYSYDLVNEKVQSCAWCMEIEENARRSEEAAKRSRITVPLIPTEAQIQRAKERAKEYEQQQLEVEKIRAAVKDGKPLPVPQITKSTRHD